MYKIERPCSVVPLQDNTNDLQFPDYYKNVNRYRYTIYEKKKLKKNHIVFGNHRNLHRSRICEQNLNQNPLTSKLV